MPQTQTQRRRRAVSDDSEEDDAEDNGESMMDTDGDEQIVKRFVRYALACEYQRMPIRRAGILEKGPFSCPTSFSIPTIAMIRTFRAIIYDNEPT